MKRHFKNKQHHDPGIVRLTVLVLMAVIIISNVQVALAFSPDDLARLRETGKCEGCDLRGANLFGEDLSRVKLNRADLRGADLTAAELFFTSLNEADLRGANLTEANMRGANLAGANVEGAVFSKTIICHTTMPDGELHYEKCPLVAPLFFQ